jgi:hypothetical protein
MRFASRQNALFGNPEVGVEGLNAVRSIAALHFGC